jgi:hypothetical protein
MLCVYFFLNNQQDALIIQVYSVTKLVSGIFSAHHQEFFTVHLALLGSGHQKPA